MYFKALLQGLSPFPPCRHKVARAGAGGKRKASRRKSFTPDCARVDP